MLFNEGFLSKLSTDPVTGILSVTQITLQELNLDGSSNWDESHYEILLESYALLSSLEETGLLSPAIEIPEISGNMNEDCRTIYDIIQQVQGLYMAEASKLKVQSYKAHFKTNFSGVFAYEFSQGDLDRIQTLINELREHVSKSNDFEVDHKRRLLSRLEKLQSELHKKMSDLDKFWGLVGDAGVVAGKFGQDVKPIVDRIRELTEIVWRTQARAEELPSDSPLPKLEDKSGEMDV